MATNTAGNDVETVEPITYDEPIDYTENNVVTMTLSSFLLSRACTADEAWANYQRACKRYNVLPLWGQFQAAAKRLRKDGKIRVIMRGDQQLIVRV